MIIGIGTDIVEVGRIEGVFQRQGEVFAKRLLSEQEWSRFKDHPFPARFLAKRWALKEAVSKALGTGLAQGVSFHNMTIKNHESGQPYLELTGGALEKSNSLGITSWSISVSDEKTHAVAFAVAEKTSKIR
ncbi:MAG: holo-ACP synthase [Pseudomonadota bacterium]|nr:holo-ACP synthase [Pseudomonadota bacterium]